VRLKGDSVVITVAVALRGELTSQAIYLEEVTDLFVETFLLAFRWFASHKSLPQVIVSDNASTYSAASEELQ